jgi:hypothetical protein
MKDLNWEALLALVDDVRVPSWPDAVAFVTSNELYVVAGAFGLALALLWLRLRSVSRSYRTLRGEMSRMQMQLLGIERLQFESEKKYGQFDYRISDLDARQRRAEARLGKPDTKLAVALTRAGASSRELVDCGLSHGESHLLQGLNARAAAAAAVPEGRAA